MYDFNEPCSGSEMIEHKCGSNWIAFHKTSASQKLMSPGFHSSCRTLGLISFWTYAHLTETNSDALLEWEWTELPIYYLGWWRIVCLNFKIQFSTPTWQVPTLQRILSSRIKVLFPMKNFRSIEKSSSLLQWPSKTCRSQLKFFS